MRKISIILLCLLAVTTVVEASSFTVEIEPGEEYLHRFRLFWFIHIANPPQLAVWVEHPDGQFIQNLYVTERTALGNWRSAPGDDSVIERKESLPLWSASGSQMPDVISSASMKAPESITATLDGPLEDELHVYLEVNHSTDFNESYPMDAAEGSPAYSGGPMGSGQPALVYRLIIPATERSGRGRFELIGYSSPDGSDSLIRPIDPTITTALDILSDCYLSWDR